MDSISSLVKKHCHCGVNIICGLLLTIHSALSVIYAVMVPHPAYIAIGAVLTLITVFSWIYIFGCKIGCTLLRIPIIILDALSFIISLLSCAIGVLFIAHSEAGTYLEQLITQYGIEELSLTPYVAGIALIVIGLIFFALSFCLLAGVRYFGSIKKCLDGEIRRNGAKIFGISCIILFVFVSLIVILNTANMLMNRSFYDVIISFPDNIIYINLWLKMLLLLFIGISANSFSSKTYAFKVFENQMLKVESNADGTVYVPISEETETTVSTTVSDKVEAAPVNRPVSFDTAPIAASDTVTATEKHKPYIREGQVDIPDSDKKPKSVNTETGESDII